MTAPAEVLDAVERGWSVLPIGPDKKPLVKWKPAQGQAATLAEVEAWAARLKPPAWAVVTGKVSSLVALDFDGDAGLERLAEFDLVPNVRTGSGGAHVYFEHPGRTVGTLNGRAAHALGAHFPGLDVRGDGGYAVFCGRNGAGPYLLERADPWPWPDFPAAVRDFLGFGDPEAPPAPERLVDAALARAAGGEGRNNAGFWLACQLRDAGLAAGDAERAGATYLARCPATDGHGQTDPYTDAEWRASVDSAYSRAPRTPASPRAGATPTGALEVSFDGTGKGAPKLVLPSAPALEDVVGQCAWLTAVFNLNAERPIDGGTHAGVRGQDGHVIFTRRGAPEIRFEPAGRMMKPDRLTETLEAWGQPDDGQVYGYKAEHCRQINHVARMLYGRSETLSVEQESAGLVSVYVQSALAIEELTTYGTTGQRYEAATALQRELDSTGRPTVAPKYLLDVNTGELVIRVQDLGEAARRYAGSSLQRGWLDGRMASLGWQRVTLAGYGQPGRSGRSGPHARCDVYRGLLTSGDEDPVNT